MAEAECINKIQQYIQSIIDKDGAGEPGNQ
jgi:hypothetical protein